jgi:hypothetical protein
MTSKEDLRPEHGKEPPERKDHPEDHGRPVKPHRSSAQAPHREVKPK